MSTTLECVINIAVNAVNQILRTISERETKKGLQSNRLFAEKLLKSVSQGNMALGAGRATKSK